MTRLLADEGVERAVVQALRAGGYDVAWVVEIARGAEDEQVIALAAQEQRVLITNDKDFGNLAVRQGYPVSGVVLLRLPQSTAEQKAARVLQVLQTLGERLSGHFTVITEWGARTRRLSHTLGDGEGSMS